MCQPTNQVENRCRRILCVTCSRKERTDRWKRQRNVQGVLGVHVDDLVGGRDLTFKQAVQWLRTELELGTWDQSRFRFGGRELSQKYNRSSIKISMSKFCSRNGACCCSQTCERRFGRAARSKRALSFRGDVGQLQWLQLQGNPLLLFATEVLQSKSATPIGHDLLDLNKLMREAKSMLDFCWSSRPRTRLWANRPDGCIRTSCAVSRVLNCFSAGLELA